MRVLLGQLEISPGDAARNVERLSAALAEHPDADLAVFPELFLCGYDVDRIAGLAMDPDDPQLAAVRSTAAEHGTAVLVGYAERLPGGGVANAVACIAEDGAWAGSYRKTNLFGRREREVFTPGDEQLVVELAGVPVAPMVCFDVEFPEPARAVARAGARVLVTVAANMAPYGADHELAAAARALDNRLPHVYVNRVGDEGSLRFAGASCVMRSDGSVQHLLSAGPSTATVDLDLAVPIPADVDYLTHVRPQLPVHVSRPTPVEGLSK